MHPFTRRPRESVAALGEERLILALRRWLGPASPRSPFGMGDDCAVLAPARNPQLLTVDPVIFGRHFSGKVSPRAVGAKLLKRNLSDIAAMGGRPTAAVVALTLDAAVSLRWLEQFYRGIAACARRYGVRIVGGDVAQAEGVLVASLTLLGETTGSRAVTRRGARSGDWIFVTGQFGGSLHSGHHHRFIPRLREGAWFARHRSVRAMMDVSDGLAKDLPAMAPERAVATIDPDALPRRRGCDLRSALTDGEDYELVVAVAGQTDRAAFHRAWQRAFPGLRLSCIGQFAPAGKVPAGFITLNAFRGYEHLRP